MQDSVITITLNEQQQRLHESIYQNRLLEIRSLIEKHEAIIKELEDEAMMYKLFLSKLEFSELKAANVPYKNETVIGIGNTLKLGTTAPYDSEASLAKKCEFVIADSGMLLGTRQIAEKILDFESDYLKKKEITFDRFQKNIGSVLVQKIEKRDTFYRDRVNGEFRYGLIKNMR